VLLIPDSPSPHVSWYGEKRRRVWFRWGSEGIELVWRYGVSADWSYTIADPDLHREGCVALLLRLALVNQLVRAAEIDS
jgi:hypothetical protein